MTDFLKNVNKKPPVPVGGTKGLGKIEKTNVDDEIKRNFIEAIAVATKYVNEKSKLDRPDKNFLNSLINITKDFLKSRV